MTPLCACAFYIWESFIFTFLLLGTAYFITISRKSISLKDTFGAGRAKSLCSRHEE